ncbi:helix-turn-helix domain-containing protein [Cytophaga hutchinsonii]|uniref:HTH cro/C1-type domain-containing protein n=1 Tax=Cytophaga hutchinsonii (strain ATCC 33406 / DSM 1761 / CIP 103989 / NBRC 15051 / NCIMB 9469 / D465) TaxID=269798 RepID=A0A6N4SQ95_CYTH3|nr:transcriptional regulator [Cytophaga hutchinsonii]ABG58453.1 hypothetical protein CHU_1178 [Cytophaga hutchinsonii ATCC 33406]SFX74780.1 hypothetical protein SAMN04487930_10920 [Cytophaga hutchinsonii ATCC 33406]
MEKKKAIAKKLGNNPAKKVTKVTKKVVNKKTDKHIQALAARIRQIRKKLGYTNADFFAYEHNISRSQFSRYESGEDIRFSSLMNVINALGMTAEEFFSEGFD